MQAPKVHRAVDIEELLILEFVENGLVKASTLHLEVNPETLDALIACRSPLDEGATDATYISVKLENKIREVELCGCVCTEGRGVDRTVESVSGTYTDCVHSCAPRRSTLKNEQTHH